MEEKYSHVFWRFLANIEKMQNAEHLREHLSMAATDFSL